jgi:Na+(H+)/acetate symporter ActP
LVAVEEAVEEEEEVATPDIVAVALAVADAVTEVTTTEVLVAVAEAVAVAVGVALPVAALTVVDRYAGVQDPKQGTQEVLVVTYWLLVSQVAVPVVVAAVQWENTGQSRA